MTGRSLPRAFLGAIVVAFAIAYAFLLPFLQPLVCLNEDLARAGTLAAIEVVAQRRDDTEATTC